MNSRNEREERQCPEKFMSNFIDCKSSRHLHFLLRNMKLKLGSPVNFKISRNIQQGCNLSLHRVELLVKSFDSPKHKNVQFGNKYFSNTFVQQIEQHLFYSFNRIFWTKQHYLVFVFGPFSKPEYIQYSIFGVFLDPEYIRYSVFGRNLVFGPTLP